MQNPAPGSTWEHAETGMIYTVEQITNQRSTREDYPPTVVYHDENGDAWSRPLAKWPGKMKQCLML